MGDIIRIMVIVGVIFYNKGLPGVIDLFKDVIYATWEFLKMINMISVELLGESLLTRLFSHGIVFYIVGLIFSVLYIPRSKIGKYVGRFLYKVIMCPVSSFLDFLGGNKIFKI